jgi:hypothetical protein
MNSAKPSHIYLKAKLSVSATETEDCLVGSETICGFITKLPSEVSRSPFQQQFSKIENTETSKQF